MPDHRVSIFPSIASSGFIDWYDSNAEARAERARFRGASSAAAAPPVPKTKSSAAINGLGQQLGIALAFMIGLVRGLVVDGDGLFEPCPFQHQSTNGAQSGDRLLAAPDPPSNRRAARAVAHRC